ncbi:cytochrome c oxidase subunit VA-domain-containing protein [Tuber borchii]|uniref:Cytochrome c oxidase subunit 6, mitochondrial n=1 Tax=Tuber borchii TaxID=42251 RepID=A0A2T6ZQC0_TUBBO|nr:cytochrome c oxidase subunit VA-domain-containing protein [Tuber borchii]
MPFTSFLRLAARQPLLRTSAPLPRLVAAVPSLRAKTSLRFYSEGHEESFEEFTARYEKEFENVNDVFELQRNLNNAFAYDLVPSPSVIIAALKAARRVNDFPTAVRIFEGIKAKVENKQQYQQYLDELKDLREELGIALVEDMYPENK